MFVRFLFLHLIFLSPLLAIFKSDGNPWEIILGKYDSMIDREWKMIEGFSSGIVTSCKQILLPQFPSAFNPSIIKVEKGYLLSFRYCPEPSQRPWISFIGVVELDEGFIPISTPQLLDTRVTSIKTESQAEDARLFNFGERIFLIYNDNVDVKFPTNKERRDIYLAELFKEDDTYYLSTPLKLFHSKKYAVQLWQKNWIPFQWGDKLVITYSINPHEILEVDLETGECSPLFETNLQIPWKFGSLRGSTPPVEIEKEYCAFFHSGVVIKSEASGWENKWHYFMGAYTFSKDPPFEIKKITPLPIISPLFYHNSGCEKRVIFPSGCFVDDEQIYISYGRDDCEMWIATINQEKLKKILYPLLH